LIKATLGYVCQKVAKHLAVTAATASDAVTSLVDKGLVQKRDRLRMDAIAITLTTQGTADSDTNSVLV